MNYVDTFFGGTTNFKKILVDEIEKHRKHKRVSIKEMDKWNFNDGPCYSECRKNKTKIDKRVFPSFAMGLNLCADTILFKHISRKSKKRLGKKCPSNSKIIFNALSEI